MKCRECGRFMRRFPGVRIWACGCGQTLAEVSDFKAMQVFFEVLLTRPEREVRDG